MSENETCEACDGLGFVHVIDENDESKIQHCEICEKYDSDEIVHNRIIEFFYLMTGTIPSEEKE